MRISRDRSGMGLMILVALIAIGAILILSSERFFENMARQVELRIDETKAVQFAQAGVIGAAWIWYTSDTDNETDRRWTSFSSDDPGNYSYQVGGPADDVTQANYAYYSFDLTDDAAWVTAAANMCTQGGVGAGANGACRRLRLWRIRNIQSDGGSDIIFSNCKVSWSPAGAETLTTIQVNDGSDHTLLSDGSVASGTDIDITDQALTAGSVFSGAGTYLEWSAEPGGDQDVTVTIQWTFSDDSSTLDSRSHEVLYWRGAKPTEGRPTQHTFDVVSTGSIANTQPGSFTVKKSIKAVISGAPGAAAIEIMGWEPEDKNLS